jgi:transposase
MATTTTIGLDLAKNVFQVHGCDRDGRTTIRRQLKRRDLLAFFEQQPPCLVGMEACGGSHDWARRIAALGHDVRQLPAEDVKAYRRHNKTDAADAEAICEAVSRPRIKVVPTKTVAQQELSVPHTVRNHLITTQTATRNMIRSLLSEFGITAPAGDKGMATLLARVVDEGMVNEGGADETRTEITASLRAPLMAAAAVLAETEASLARINALIAAQARSDDRVRRLKTIPGVGPLIASAFVAAVTAPQIFPSGRAFAASLGVTPKMTGTGGEVTYGPISKRGNIYLRRLLYMAAAARLAAAQKRPGRADPRLVALLARMPFRKAALVLANKTARIIWVLLKRGGTFIDNHLPATHADRALARQ